MPYRRNFRKSLDLRHPSQKALLILLGSCIFGVVAVGAGLRATAQDSSQEARAQIASLFQQARRAEQQRDFVGAARLYDTILQIDPKLAEVWTNKGLVLHELSKHREALAAFAKAATLKPKLLTPHLFLGIEYLKLGEPRNALKPLQAALALEPHYPQATYELANAYAQLEQFQLATETYRDLIRRNPQMEQGWYRLGITYMNWSKAAARKLVNSSLPSPYGKILLAELQAVGGIYLDAESNYRSAIASLPDSPEARLALAQFYLDFQTDPERVRAAREQLDKAQSLAPGDLRVAVMSVRLALVQENYSEALANLEKVLGADLPFARRQLSELLIGFPPEALRKVISGVCEGEAPVPGMAGCAGQNAAVSALLYAGYLELGDAKLAEESRRAFEEHARKLSAKPAHPELGSYSQRLKQLEQAQRARPLALRERTELAVCAYNLGEYDQALRALLDVLKQSANDEALYWLSLNCRALARETFLEAIKTNPDSYRSHLLLADLANDRHDAAQAQAEYERAVVLGGGDPEVHLLLVQFLESQGKDEEALARTRAAVEKFPAHPALNCELGKLLLRAKKAGEAEPYFQQALAADPTFASARAGLADSHAALGDTEKAVQEMKQALSADTDGSYHYRLGRWLQKTGQTREANEAFAISTRLKEERLKRDSERFKNLRPRD
jgi:tetratricopeptide (TPR) repeat protein